MAIASAVAASDRFSVPADYELPADSSNGVAIVAMTIPEGVFAYPPTCRWSGRTITAMGETSEMEGWRASKDPAIFYSQVTRNALGRPAMLGRLTALVLPAGEYRFSKCGQRGAMQEIKRSGQPFDLAFTVSAGEVTYVGSLQVTTGLPGNLMEIAISNQFERDAKLIRQLWPRLAVGEIHTRLLEFQPSTP